MTVATRGTATPSTDLRARLHELAARRFERSIDASVRFFEANADAIPRACLAMARRFESGGRLLVFGHGAALSDARHVSVEFVHPVLVGKRALPAMVIESAHGDIAETLLVLGRCEDIALWIAAEPDADGALALARARAAGMLTIALTYGETATTDDSADVVFRVMDADAFVVQEVHETLYHVLWELVHVFLDRGARQAGIR